MKTRKRNGGATSTWHPRLRTRQAEPSLLARRLTQLQSCAVASALTLAGIAAAPVALADSADNVRVAVVAARGATCGPPLQANPVVDRAAEAINQTTDNWINNVGRSVPETDALPILNDLGYAGNKARILSAAAKGDGDAIKALLLQGWADLPDCSYVDFGVDVLYNAKKDMNLMTVVLAS